MHKATPSLTKTTAANLGIHPAERAPRACVMCPMPERIACLFAYVLLVLYPTTSSEVEEWLQAFGLALPSTFPTSNGPYANPGPPFCN